MIDHLIYTGKVRHRRFSPKPHQFSYDVFMFFFDLNKIIETLQPITSVSIEKLNHYSYYRKNYLSQPTIPLAQHVRQLVQKKYNVYPTGKIYLLTQLSCLGYCFNPISLYFIFNNNEIDLDYLIVEVTNTPWGERHNYILANPKKSKSNTFHYQFEKKLHVSPFLAMNYLYKLNLKLTANKIILHMENHANDERHFDATLILSANEDNKPEEILRQYPFMAFKTTAAIYWQALKLWMKGVPFYPHPKLGKR